MTQNWEPGTQYNHNDVVEYQGHRYKIIQPHRSQSDWTPDITPALWGRLSDDHSAQHHHHQQDVQQQNWQQQQPQQPPAYDQGKQEQGPSPSTDNKGEKKSWIDEHKQELKIGGGLLAGAAIIGTGVGLFKHHEDKKETAQSFDAWANAAMAHKKEFLANGPRSPATWVYNEGSGIPRSAISTGREQSWDLYICRVYINGGVYIGKASDAFRKGAAVVGYDNKENHFDKYEILLGDMGKLKWVPCSNKINVDYLGATPVQGGYDNDNTPLYIVKALHKDAWHPGKAGPKLGGAFIPYGGKEVEIKEYEVLCYA